MDMTNNVLVENLSFNYANTGKEIFKSINMNVEEGQFVCILGKSGCGKSTLLRLLAGLEKPTTGSIKVGGEALEGASLKRGVVFQDYGLYPWMTAGRNIELALEQKYPKMPKEERKEKAADVLDKVGLHKEVYDLLPKQLSGGMKQRCAIARAFAINPPVLLMDEPFGALDAVTRVKLQDMLLELWQESKTKKTVFFVTHDVDEALYLADKIYVLGQSGSDIIYECELSDKERASRSGKENEESIELRNELMYQINKDVSSRLKETVRIEEE